MIRLLLAEAEGFAGRAVGRLARRLAYVAACVVGALCCGIGAFACALAALWIYAIPHVGAVGAPLIVAGLLLAIAVGLLALSGGFRRARRAPPAMNIDHAAMAAELSEMVKTHKAPTIIAALLAGVMAGTRSR